MSVARKGDHIRLQYVNLSYDVKGSILDKTGIKQLQVYGNAANLGILWKANHFGLDPDYFNSLYATGAARTVSLGLRANF